MILCGIVACIWIPFPKSGEDLTENHVMYFSDTNNSSNFFSADSVDCSSAIPFLTPHNTDDCFEHEKRKREPCRIRHLKNCMTKIFETSNVNVGEICQCVCP